MTTLSRELKQAVQEFLKNENRLNSEIEKFQTAMLIENESEIARLSLRVDLMEGQLKKEVKVNATCFKMSEMDFISLVTYYEENN